MALSRPVLSDETALDCQAAPLTAQKRRALATPSGSEATTVTVTA